MNYISVSLYRKIIEHAFKEGMTAADISDLPTPYHTLNALQVVPADEFFGLHEKLEKDLGAGFSVRVGQEMKMEDYGVLGLSWRTCFKAGEIFERSERYFKLLSNTYVFKVEKDQEVSKVHLFREASRRGIGLSNEATFSATIVVLKAMTETEIAPVSVSFKHDPPSDLKSYHETFRCPVLFNQTENFIAYQTSDLEKRTAKADASINKFLLERVEEETQGISISATKISSDIEQLIKDALPSGIPSIDYMSELLTMSSRTLTRRLSDDGTTFRGLIKKIQEQIAKDLLLNSSRSVGEIAFEIGFSEQSAFSRAFKNWTGTSPVDFRNLH